MLRNDFIPDYVKPRGSLRAAMPLGDGYVRWCQGEQGLFGAN